VVDHICSKQAHRASDVAKARAVVSHRAINLLASWQEIAICAQIATTGRAQTTTVSFMSTTHASKQRTATAIRFPGELHEQLRQAADERDLSINYLVVKAVEQFLPQLIPADELTLTRAS